MLFHSPTTIASLLPFGLTAILVMDLRRLEPSDTSTGIQLLPGFFEFMKNNFVPSLVMILPSDAQAMSSFELMVVPSSEMALVAVLYFMILFSFSRC